MPGALPRWVRSPSSASCGLALTACSRSSLTAVSVHGRRQSMSCATTGTSRCASTSRGSSPRRSRSRSRTTSSRSPLSTRRARKEGQELRAARAPLPVLQPLDGAPARRRGERASKTQAHDGVVEETIPLPPGGEGDGHGHDHTDRRLTPSATRGRPYPLRRRSRSLSVRRLARGASRPARRSRSRDAHRRGAAGADGHRAAARDPGAVRSPTWTRAARHDRAREVLHRQELAVRAALRSAVLGLGGGAAIEQEVLFGSDPASSILGAAGADVALLVLGSRAYGPRELTAIDDLRDPGVIEAPSSCSPATARTNPTASTHDGRVVTSPFPALTTSVISCCCAPVVTSAHAVCPSPAAWARR